MTGWVSTLGATSPVLWLLPSQPKSVGVVRQRLTALVARLPTSRLDDVQLAASEVVTNAVLHGDGPVAWCGWRSPTTVKRFRGYAGTSSMTVREVGGCVSSTRSRAAGG